LHTYARCTTKPASDHQEAYAASAANTLYLFDDLTRGLTEGSQTVSSQGSALGLASVGNATLTVTVRHIQETGNLWAHAMVEVSVDAVLFDKAGGQLYTGPLLDIAIGHVTVDCNGMQPPTTTSTTTSTTTTTSGSTTTTGGSTTTATTTTTTTTTGVTGATTTTPGTGGGSLAGTGFRAGPPVALGLLLVMAGGAVLLLRRKRLG